jgi:hypothetical protein
MAKVITAAEKIARARSYILKAREYPVPSEGLGRSEFSYMAQVKDLLRQAREQVKFIQQTMGISSETKEDARKVVEEIEAARRDLLY